MSSESINWREAVVVTVLVAALLAIGTVTAEAQRDEAMNQLECKQLGNLFTATQLMAVNDAAKKKINDPKAKDLVGRGFFEYCFKNKILDTPLLKRCVSPRSLAGDSESDGKFIDDDKLSMPQSACSFATPKLDKLFTVLNLRGKHKRIAYCWDSRNWFNAKADGVLAIWSTGEDARFIDAEEALTEYQISGDEYAKPDEKIFGKPGPFLFVFEEEAGAKATKELRAEFERCKVYLDLFKKKGRVIKFKVTTSEGKEIVHRLEVVEVTEKEATLKHDTTNLGAEAGSGTWGSTTIDFSDPIKRRPPGKKESDKTEEIEAAGRKWKCEKWVDGTGDEQLISWASVEYPGLVVKQTGTQEGILISFTDPK